MDNGNLRAARPLSPHLQIYRMTLTMAMSLFHRATGIALYGGAAIFAWWLLALASGPNAYATFGWFIGSFIGRIVLLGLTWSLLHHLLGGLRHFIWDSGMGFSPEGREMLAKATIIGSLVLTVLIWAVGYMVR